VKKETYSGNKAEIEDSTDESDADSDPGLDEPKHSPIRRKEKFRTKDFSEGKIHKDRKRNGRHKMKQDFEF
jgi:hypothetical protein